MFFSYIIQAYSQAFYLKYTPLTDADVFLKQKPKRNENILSSQNLLLDTKSFVCFFRQDWCLASWKKKKKKKTFYSPCLRKQPSRNITGSLCCQKKIWSWDFSTISKNILIYLEPGLSQHDSFKHLITKLLFRFLKAVAICNFHSFQKMKDSPYVGYVMIDSRVTFLQFVTRMTTFSRHCSL